MTEVFFLKTGLSRFCNSLINIYLSSCSVQPHLEIDLFILYFLLFNRTGF